MAKKNKMISCKHCGKEIAATAKTCPSCGGKNKKPFFKKWWFWVIVVILIFAFSGGDSDSETSTNDSGANNNVSTEDSKDIESNNKIDNVVAEEDDKIPTEYKSALKKAKSYSDGMHMSKAGIYNQLTSEYGEQFTEEAAQYAIDNLEEGYK